MTSNQSYDPSGAFFGSRSGPANGYYPPPTSNAPATAPYTTSPYAAHYPQTTREQGYRYDQSRDSEYNRDDGWGLPEESESCCLKLFCWVSLFQLDQSAKDDSFTICKGRASASQVGPVLTEILSLQPCILCLRCCNKGNVNGCGLA